jgi:hypothetical protein
MIMKTETLFLFLMLFAPCAKAQQQLGEVVVTSSLPVKVNKDGSLQYDAKSLLRHHPANSVMELIGGVPTINKQGNGYVVVGASSTALLVNGRKRNMSDEQLRSWLSSLPASRVKNIEVMYNAPLRYGVKGAAINIVLKKEKSEEVKLSGEMSASAVQRFRPSWLAGMNANVASKKISANFGYSVSHDDKRRELDLLSLHSLRNAVYDIHQNSVTRNKSFAHNIYGDFSWDISDEASLALSYSGQIKSPKSNISATTNINGSENNDATRNAADENLHNMDLQFDYGNLNIGAELTLYHQDNNQTLESAGNMLLNGHDRQNSVQTGLDISHSIKLPFGKMEYGVAGKYSSVDNGNRVLFADNAERNVLFSSNQTEKTLSAYVGIRKPLGKRGFVKLSLQGEYFHSSLDSLNTGKNTTLWSDFHLYPQLTIMYKTSPNANVQLAVNSEKRYPSFWSTASARSYFNSYCAAEGNSCLKPYLHYGVNLNYIIKAKYIMGLFADLNDDFSAQVLTQSGSELVAIYRFYNFDYSHRLGFLSVVPMKWGGSFSSRVTVMAFDMWQKGAIDNQRFSR